MGLVFLKALRSAAAMLTISLCLIASLPSAAQDGKEGHTHTPDGSHMQNVETMLELIGVPAQVNKVAADMMTLYSAKVDPGNKDPNVQKIVATYQDSVRGVVDQVLSWEALKTTYISSYAKRMSPEEVAAVSGFLLSPEGEKFSKVQQQASIEIQGTAKHLAEVDMAPALAKLTNRLREGLMQIEQAHRGSAPK